MLPQTVLDRQVSRQLGVLRLVVLERYGVVSSLAKGLNEPLGLAVGPWCAGPELTSEDSHSPWTRFRGSRHFCAYDFRHVQLL